MNRFACALIAATLPVPAFAAGQVALDNMVFVERVKADADGRKRVELERPNMVVPGDRLVFVLNYRNTGAKAAERFVITNPLPAAVQFQGGDDAAQVSIDGGVSWGRLDALRVRDANGTMRPAMHADVTHIRWAFQQPIPAGGSGKLMFRGVVK